MCISNKYYPLISFYDEDSGEVKKKIIFSKPYFLNNFDDFNNFKSKNEELKSQFEAKGFGFDGLVSIPCGKCSECLNERARQWMFRIMKECEAHMSNYFVTLTYDDDNCPAFLVKDEISKFNKKLKTYLKRKGMKSDFRFYGVGEYGSNTFRPHYHVIYFGLELDDLMFYKTDSQGYALYNSRFLERIWNKGFVVVGHVDAGSAAYVSRYTEKKQMLTYEEKQNRLKIGMIPEFSVMSRNPGIGVNYVEQASDNIKNEIYSFPYQGRQYSIPRFISKKLESQFLLGNIDVSSYNNYMEHRKNTSSDKVFKGLQNALNAGYDLFDYNVSVEKAKKRIKLSKKLL